MFPRIQLKISHNLIKKLRNVWQQAPIWSSADSDLWLRSEESPCHNKLTSYNNLYIRLALPISYQWFSLATLTHARKRPNLVTNMGCWSIHEPNVHSENSACGYKQFVIGRGMYTCERWLTYRNNVYEVFEKKSTYMSPLAIDMIHNSTLGDGDICIALNINESYE